MITRKALGHISEDLLARLLKALHPIALDEQSTQYHIGYYAAQRDFRSILEHALNAGPLPEHTAPAPALPKDRKKWWQ